MSRSGQRTPCARMRRSFSDVSTGGLTVVSRKWSLPPVSSSTSTRTCGGGRGSALSLGSEGGGAADTFGDAAFSAGTRAAAPATRASRDGPRGRRPSRRAEASARRARATAPSSAARARRRVLARSKSDRRASPWRRTPAGASGAAGGMRREICIVPSLSPLIFTGRSPASSASRSIFMACQRYSPSKRSGPTASLPSSSCEL